MLKLRESETLYEADFGLGNVDLREENLLFWGRIYFKINRLAWSDPK